MRFQVLRPSFAFIFVAFVACSSGSSGENVDDDSTSDTSDDTATDVAVDVPEDSDEDAEEDAASDTSDESEPDTPDIDPTDTESDTEADAADADEDTDAESDAEVDITEDADASTTVSCPDTLPERGAACAVETLECQYGDDPRRECRPLAVCEAGGWRIRTAPETCEDEIPAAECPETRADASGAACETMDAYCTYEGIVCHCTNCVDGPVGGCFGDPTWMCERPNTVRGCPEAMPNLGEACDGTRARCEYRCGTGGATECTDGVWVSAEGTPCPISTREVKENIRYLAPAEVDEIAAQTLDLPLTTWEYTDASIGEGTHLGIIIEDAPGSYAVDEDRQMVDLYGYTSMLLATVQAQQRQIDELREQLESLSREPVADKAGR